MSASSLRQAFAFLAPRLRVGSLEESVEAVHALATLIDAERADERARCTEEHGRKALAAIDRAVEIARVA